MVRDETTPLFVDGVLYASTPFGGVRALNPATGAEIWSFDSELDSAGRVTLNPALLAHGQITKDVVLVGVIDHLQVWDRERWLTDQDQLSAEIVEIAESLGHPS